jgi:hypothetical protein
MAPARERTVSAPAFPSVFLPNGCTSIFDYVGSQLPSPFSMRKVPNPQSAASDIELARYEPTAGSDEELDPLRPPIILAMSLLEMAQIQGVVGSVAPSFGPPMLTLKAGPTHGVGSDAFWSYATSLTMLSGQAPVTRVEKPLSLLLYVDSLDAA